MPAKKKGKGKKKKSGVAKVPKKDGEEEVKEEIPKPPETGYINLKLRLCNPPEPNGKDFCFFNVFMLSSARIMMVKDEITEYHGRVENIRLYDKEPPKINA